MILQTSKVIEYIIGVKDKKLKIRGSKTFDIMSKVIFINEIFP